MSYSLKGYSPLGWEEARSVGYHESADRKQSREILVVSTVFIVLLQDPPPPLRVVPTFRVDLPASVTPV